MALLLSAARSPGGVAAPPNGHYMNTYFFKGGFAVRGVAVMSKQNQRVKVRCALALWFLYVQQESLQTRRWGTPEAELVILAFSVSQILSAIF